MRERSPDQQPAAAPMLACPVHGTAEMVQRVSAVYKQGTRTAISPTSGVALVRTDLAVQLSPEPLVRLVGRAVLHAAAWATLTLVVTDALIESRHQPGTFAGPSPGTLVFVIGSLVLVLCLFVGRALLRVSRRSRVRRGRAAAREVWDAGWYCGRCDGVFFLPPRPGGAAAGALLSADVFRRMVWTAGGYTSWGKR